VRVPYKGTYLRLSTGIKIPPYATFSTTKQAFSGKGDEVKLLNSEKERHYLFILEAARSGYDLKKEYESFVEPCFEQEEEESYDLVSLFNRYIAGASKGDIRKKDGSRLKPSTISNLRYSVTIFQEYSGLTGKLDLLNFNLSSIQDLNKKKQLAERWDTYFNGFLKYMSQKGLKINTKSIVLLNLGIMLNHFTRSMFIMVPQIPRLKQIDNPIVVLDSEFIFGTFLVDGKYSKLEGNLRYAWEIAATILVTTMRVSDVMELKWGNLIDRKDGMFLNKTNIKTGGQTNMIIPKVLANIYRDNMAKYGQIYTPCAEHKEAIIYRELENLFAMYPELHNQVSVTMVSPSGELELVTKKLYEWVKPHMLRKSAITSMLVKGISEQHVKFASGHKHDSKAFEKYRGFIDRNFNNELNNYYGDM
jgi:hypothetical protein